MNTVPAQSSTPPPHTPRFSIVVPAFNAADTIKETLSSIADQSLNDWECIVVDDGSTDETRSVSTRSTHGDGRFRIISQENRGTGGAYNTGVGAARGTFVVICSADDLLLKEHLAIMADFIDAHPHHDIFSTNGYVWMPAGELKPRYSPNQEETSLSLADVVIECFYSVGATYRRSIFDAIGGYSEAVFGEDYDFWLRAIASGARHRYLPEILSQHRQGPEQKSAQLERWWLSDIEIVRNLVGSFELSEREVQACRELVRDRERRIRRLRDPMRQRLHAVAHKLVGSKNLDLVISRVRFMYRRRLKRSAWTTRD